MIPRLFVAGRTDLGSAGYDVVEASDGFEGLSVIKSALPALVLCDLNMPRMGGMEMLASSLDPARPVMVMLTTRLSGPDPPRRELGAWAGSSSPSRPTSSSRGQQADRDRA